MQNKNFVVRVYGIGQHENKILVIDEYWHGMKMTKFPGGGLEYGEGTLDCLRRECMEELGQKIEILEHFYTTDFFQQALFRQEMQLLSIYYLIKFEEPNKIKTKTKPFDFELFNGEMAPRWIDLDAFKEDLLTLPIDRTAARLLIETKQKNKLIRRNRHF